MNDCGDRDPQGISCTLPAGHKSVLHAAKVHGRWVQWEDMKRINELRAHYCCPDLEVER